MTDLATTEPSSNDGDFSASAQTDYFAFSHTEQVYLPDKISFVEIKALNEGDRREYLNKQNREITVERRTQDMKLKVESGEERLQLLMRAIVEWNFRSADSKGVMHPVACNDPKKRDFLTRADPKIVDIIDKAVRKLNPWLNQDVTVADIDKQIEELNELRAEKVKEEESGNS